MMFWVGTTDTRWFGFLAPRGLDEVNFRQPSARAESSRRLGLST
jgi:hypothetical protein